LLQLFSLSGYDTGWTTVRSPVILQWADDHKIAWHYIAPGAISGMQVMEHYDRDVL
jgi:hypothetical protein